MSIDHKIMTVPSFHFVIGSFFTCILYYNCFSKLKKRIYISMFAKLNYALICTKFDAIAIQVKGFGTYKTRFNLILSSEGMYKPRQEYDNCFPIV